VLLTRVDSVDLTVDLRDGRLDAPAGLPDDISHRIAGASPVALASFLVVARELSFTGAARLLYLSQPGLSRRIQSLERQLGVPLLSRTTRKVLLTPEGTSVRTLLLSMGEPDTAQSA
jgi:Bacterial regulatory helix-turn-helix protein, lysR family